ncbi:hypothetical protein HanIR_Chr14g0727251 [Helianthus annuus]|nr:hypothetical protein HanIR_Chr14g0727251 [Helianthus annuus]
MQFWTSHSLPPPLFFCYRGVQKLPLQYQQLLLHYRQREGSVNKCGTHRACSSYFSYQANGQSKFQNPAYFWVRTPLAPLFAEGCPLPYAPRWKITPSTAINTAETARDFLSHALPPSQRFISVALDSEIFGGKYGMAVCAGFFRGAGMLHRVQELVEENKGLED